MEKKVVVLSSADVAAMRRAHKEAEAAYFQAKVGALEFVADEMRSTNKEYTLSELSYMTGLSTGELVAQLGFNRKAAQQAGLQRGEARWGQRSTERKFVEVTDSGEINPDSVIRVVKRETTFRIPPKRR